MRRFFLICFLFISNLVFATQTAFWREYKVDDNTYGLFHFNKDDFSDYEGKIKGVEKIGSVEYEKEGKIGGCLRLNGNGAIKYIPSEIFQGGFISIEAWIKLEKYPEDKAYIVYREAVVDKDPKYNPEVDKTKGFSLYIDRNGAINLSTTNCYYGNTTITSSPEGIVPLNTWVHIAGVSAVFPVQHRKLFLNGKEVTKKTLEWGQGLVVYGDEEKEVGPIYIGNNKNGDKGFCGLIDEVRIHKKVFNFWEKEDLSWADIEKKSEIPIKEPYYLKGHKPFLYLPLDGDEKLEICEKENIKVTLKGTGYEEGVRGKGYLGQVSIKGDKILNFDQGSCEFWVYPYNVNNWSDWNVGFVWTGWGFIFYIFNGGTPHQPLSLYFRKDDGSLHFVGCPADIDVYEGKWYQFIITWKGKEIKIYIDGKKVAESNAYPIKSKFNNGYTNEIGFGNGIIDEIYLYDFALTEEEVENCYYRYRDQTKLKKDLKEKIAKLNFQIMPGLKKFYYQVIPEIEGLEDIKILIKDEKGKEVLKIEEKYDKEEKCINTPEISEGKYDVILSIRMKGENEFKEVDRKEFIRKKFVWENNNLGISNKVPVPFEPVKVKGNKVNVVLREYKMNGFGLWDEVITKGRNILSEPIKIKGKTEKGEIKWESVRGKFKDVKETECIYEGEAISDVVEIKTKTKIEFDGCARIEMEILPGESKEKIESLYIEIPLKEKEVSLFHEIADSLRINYSGKLPEGEGIIWDGRKAKRDYTWLNNFVSYIWLGKEERGLAWFGENDKGYITEKNYEKPNETKPIQEIERKEGKVILRVYLINIPTIIEKPTKLVFGLQASPTKPMPENWRKKIQDIPGGLAVTPWGGLHCSYQGPYRDDWEIVDKIIEARYKGKVDDEMKRWFEEYNKKYSPPPTYGTWEWLSNVMHFAGRCASVGPEKPIAVYQEEMAACVIRDEWKVWQDEWTTDPYLYKRDWPSEDILRKGPANPSAGVNFCKSYQDFGVWYANEWLKRGISLYWDNTYLHISYNFRTTDAYKVDDKIQPCMLIWNQREYQKRVYNQLCYWRTQRKEPLEWTLHMTNTLVLPVHTFGTANLDHELGNTKPFSPDWLRTETIGLQIGNYPLSLYPVSGNNNEIIKKLPKEQQEKIEWAMRAVHEIQRDDNKWEKILKDFGYGEEKIEVHNYWEENPTIEINNESVKWLCLIDRDKKEMILVLASWIEVDTEVEIKINEKNIGFKVKEIIDFETGEKQDKNIKLTGPYGVKILKIY
ncbi:MAG: glycoside hydrolase domain-containing protein [Candidatus Ratteibacteria bacterium]